MLRPTITPPHAININDMQIYIACTAIGKCFQHTPTHTAVITDDTNITMPFALNALICFIIHTPLILDKPVAVNLVEFVENVSHSQPLFRRLPYAVYILTAADTIFVLPRVRTL